MFMLLAALASPVAGPADTRGADAVAAFSQLCVGMFTGRKSDIDASRFSVTELSPDTVKNVKPKLAGQKVWDVSGKASDVHMLVHYEPSGMCVVEVAEADEAAIRAAYTALVADAGKALGSEPAREPDRTNAVGGKVATTSMWRLKSSKGDVMLAMTTYPDAKFMIQHLLTVSYVR